MIITGREALLLTLLFVVTGYIMHSVAARFAFRRAERTELLLLRFVAYGTLNALIALLLVARYTKVAPKETWAAIVAQNAAPYYLLAFAVFFLLPAGLGLLLGLSHWLYDVQGWSRTPATTWDEQIARSRGQWVLLTLDGGTVAGYLGRRSFSFTDTEDRDLYLERIYRLVEDWTWQEVPRSGGMLIRGSTIKSIEFWGEPEAPPRPWPERLRFWRGRDGGRVPPDCGSSLSTAPAPAGVPEEVEARPDGRADGNQVNGHRVAPASPVVRRRRH